MKNILLVWNGMVSRQVSGGDMFTKKLVEESKYKYDIILSENCNAILSGQNVDEFFITDNKTSDNSLKIILIYSSRIFKSLTSGFTKSDREIAIASSPFLCDVIPVMFSRAKTKAVILFHLLPKRETSNFFTSIRFILASLEQKLALFIIKKKFQVIYAGNNELKAELKKKYPNKKIFVAHAGINTNKIDKFKELKKDSNLAVFVGRLTVQKGILDLVDIIQTVQHVHPELKLIIIGDGPDKQLLENKINKSKAKSIKLAGFISEKQKYELMKKAKFFMFPSYEEGWGIALAEALYCKCLSFCYELNHYKGLFDNYPIYVKKGDKTDFANAVIKAYKSHSNKNQTEFISKYDDKKVINGLIENLL